MRRTAIVFLFAALAAAPLVGQNIPPQITRPQPGGDPAYPQDTVIGELGRGEAPAEAYRTARSILTAFLRKTQDSPLFAGFGPARLTELFDGIEAVSPEKFRIGGGRIMPDGSASFLFRFVGRERGLAGELYLRQDDPPETEAAGETAGEAASPAPGRPWRLDDMLLDESHDTQVRREAYPYNFTPYERFY